MEEIQKIMIPTECVTDEVRAFAAIAADCCTLYATKNKDYGDSFNKGMDTIGGSYGVGKLYDKVNRLISIFKNNEATPIFHEPVEDTLRDLACYSIMMLAYREHALNETRNNIVME